MPEFAAIFWKELYQFSYRRRFTVENVLFIAVMAWIFLLASSRLYNFAGPRPATDYVAMSRFGRDVILGGSASVALVFVVAALFLGAESLSREVSRGTLLFLVIIPVDPAVILAAKLAAVVARVFLWLILLVPICAVASSFGGFDWTTVAVVVFFAFVNVVLYASIGLAAATTRNSRFGASGQALALVCLLYVVFGTMAAASGGLGLPVSPFTFISCTAFGPVQFASRGIISLDSVTVPAVVLLFAGALFFLAARRQWRKNMLFLVSAASTSDKLTSAPKRRRWFILPRISQFARRYIDPGMLLRELSTWGFEWMILLPVICVPFVIIALTVADPGEIVRFMTERSPQMHLFMFAFNVVAVILVFQASRRIVAEREAKTLQFLGITALQPSGILIGKALAVLVSQAPMIVFLFLHAFWLVIIGAVEVLLFIPFIISIALALAIAPAIGLYFSMAAKKSASAALFALYIAVPYSVALSVPFDKSPYSPRDFAPYLLWFLSTAAALLAACGFVFLARRFRLGLIAHALAFAAMSSHVFFLKYVLSPHVSGSQEAFYLFKEAAFGVPLVIGLAPLLLGVLAWLAWIMTSTFDTHVRSAA